VEEGYVNDQESYEKARKRVEARIGFYIHLGVYVAVNALLIVINLLTSREYLWFMWPLMGWGMGVLFHGLGVFVFSKGSSIKERMIRKEMEKQARTKS
jgi:hypothetical protein